MRGENLSGETEVFEVYENALKLSGEEVDYVIGLQPDNPDRKLKLDEAKDAEEMAKMQDKMDKDSKSSISKKNGKDKSKEKVKK